MYVDMMQMRHAEAMIYREWRGPRYPPKEKQLQALAAASTYSGQMTRAVVKRLRKAISLLIQKSPKRRIFNPVINRSHDFSIGFVTLTVADQGRDNEADVYSKCLEPWLKWARYRGMKDYVWKAELQERGTVHYHIAVNVFMHYQLIRDKWNLYQKKAGYLDKFAGENGHFRPNSTDVHAVHQVDNIEAYLCKYMVKDGIGEIAGKVWDCSKGLKKAKYFATELTPDNLDKVRMYCTAEITGEYSTVFRLPQGQAKLVFDKVQMREYRKHLLSI